MIINENRNSNRNEHMRIGFLFFVYMLSCHYFIQLNTKSNIMRYQINSQFQNQETYNTPTYFMFKCNQPVNCALGHNIFISIEIFRVHRTCGLVYDALCSLAELKCLKKIVPSQCVQALHILHIKLSLLFAVI